MNQSPTGRQPTQPNMQNIPMRTKEGRLIKEAFVEALKRARTPVR